MNTPMTAWLVAVTIAATPAAASAQRQEPGAIALGGDFGLTFKGGREMSEIGLGPHVEGFLERNRTRRTSTRVGLGWMWLDEGSGENHRVLRAAADFVWKGGGDRYNGLVGAGAALYGLATRASLEPGEPTNVRVRPGLSLLLGEEFFATATFALRGEARLHIVPNAAAYGGPALAFGVGLKKYF